VLFKLCEFDMHLNCNQLDPLDWAVLVSRGE
jgi:hypothetical protein